MGGQLLKLGLLLGEAMMQCGAEVYRVEDTLVRVLSKVGAEDVQAIATPTGIYLSVMVQGEAFTAVRRLGRTSIDLSKICDLNALSRSLNPGTPPAEALQMVKDIVARPPAYSRLQQSLLVTLAGGSFAFIFGGGLFEAVGGGVGAIAVHLFCGMLTRRGLNRFMVDFGGGAVAAFAALLLGLVLPYNIDPAIIGAIMTLVPGLTLTNAIRDALTGNLLTGTSRMVEALFIAISIAGGVGTVLSLWYRLGAII